jgi:hypothetical protein
LSQVITPSQFPPDTVSLPAPNPSNQPPQTLRLPGIESFDELPNRPLTPPRRNPSPMMVDSDASHRRLLLPGGDMTTEDRRGLPAQWDTNLHRGLTRLDINTPPRDSAGAWANEAKQALFARAEQARAAPPQPVVRFEPEVQTVEGPPASMAQAMNAPMLGPRHQHTMSAPSISAPRDTKRHGWYHGASAVGPAGETIHEGRAHVDRMIHPNISEFQGFPARERQPVIHQQSMPGMEPRTERMERIMERSPNPNGNPESLRRLEALVAVATSESSVATAY